MSVLIVTSLGDIVVDLYPDKCPLTCKNFLKLSKMNYYNGCLFHNVQKGFIAQTGDPTGTGTGGDSLYKFMYGEHVRFFSHEIHPELKHSKAGTVAMASAGENLNASQFYFTLGDGLDYLDGKHTVFGQIVEGFDILTKINEALVDAENRPYVNISIVDIYILEDPFEDPPQLSRMIADAALSKEKTGEEDVRLEVGWVPLDPQELEEVIREKAARSSAVVLESIGDIPVAEVKPPENVLFVCKLNPETTGEDLEIIFSKCGKVISAEVIRDSKTGRSLCYAFIEYETKEACEKAYIEMEDQSIDDRRIHVDFSQSVSRLWSQLRRKGSQKSGKGPADDVAKNWSGQKYMVKYEHGRDDEEGYEMVFEGGSEKGSPHGYGDGRKRHGYELDTEEDKAAGKYYVRGETERRYDEKLRREKKLTKRKERDPREDENRSKRSVKKIVSACLV